ncbi:hydroxyacid oxidase 2 (long chain) [Stylonychia lemnae]|uniref:Hydroxyacid oxidase 2 (Long chain) n=1 Tax=Stylonychia lemnae TaxID=5949 RepID=A0A077ZX05_STYLE|nr:hydroxyacid oxidase 2 (long chain) [Stylonychia lemnae]|eukprot:CDW73041.1 hydroxyacid oxidase 2 (long chain) [Stylonychia lemnae]
MNSRFASLLDYQNYAKNILSKNIYESLEDGNGDQVTKSENEEDFVRIKMKLRGMANMKYFKGIEKEFNLKKVSSPIVMGNLPLQGRFCYDGEIAAAQAAKELGIIYTLDCHKSSKCQDQIMKESVGGAKILMLSPAQTGQKRTEIIEKFKTNQDVIAFAINLGLESQTDSYQKRHGKQDQDALEQSQSAFSLNDLKSLKISVGSLPLIVKGIMNKEDALLAIQNGADAIWISNVGGRSLDTQPSAISVLKAISQTVRKANPQVQIFIDGGFRRGTEVIKAISLGADFVCLGRPIAWGLVFKGKDGLKEMIELLTEELKLGMVLTNNMSINEINENNVIHSYRYRL